MWMMYAPGSGLWFNTGITISFAEHQDAYTHFGVTQGDLNEELSKAAAAAGFKAELLASRWPPSFNEAGSERLVMHGEDLDGWDDTNPDD